MDRSTMTAYGNSSFFNKRKHHSNALLVREKSAYVGGQ